MRVVGQDTLAASLGELAYQALLGGKGNEHGPFLEELLEKALDRKEITPGQFEEISAAWDALRDRIEDQKPASLTYGALGDLRTCLASVLGIEQAAA